MSACLVDLLLRVNNKLFDSACPHQMKQNCLPVRCITRHRYKIDHKKSCFVCFVLFCYSSLSFFRVAQKSFPLVPLS